MPKDYKVKQVSPEQKQWSSQYGDMITYYIKIEGEEDEPIQINKKAESPEPKEGDDLYGDITDTQFGLKFKSAKRASGGGGGGAGYQKSPEQEENIARAVALKAAVEFHSEAADVSLDTTLDTADTFLTWLKGQKPSTEAQESSESENKRDWEKVGKKDKVQPVSDDEPIKLEDIPF